MSLCKLHDSPPVGETMHSAGQCFCHLCTCGLHKCPYSEKLSKHAASAFRSIYKKDFNRKPLLTHESPLPRHPQQSSQSRSPFHSNLKTIAQQDFVSLTPDKVKSAKYVRESHLGVLKFSGVTNYQSEFPNWGSYKFVHIGNCKRPYVENGIKLSPVTTYTQSFNKPEMLRGKSELRSVIRTNPLLPTCETQTGTTSSSAFKPFTPSHFAKRVKSVNLALIPMESPSKSYNSIYKSEFIARPPPPHFPKKITRV